MMVEKSLFHLLRGICRNKYSYKTHRLLEFSQNGINYEINPEGDGKSHRKSEPV